MTNQAAQAKKIIQSKWCLQFAIIQFRLFINQMHANCNQFVDFFSAGKGVNRVAILPAASCHWQNFRQVIDLNFVCSLVILSLVRFYAVDFSSPFFAPIPDINQRPLLCINPHEEIGFSLLF